jgi:hypothetical protein
VTATPDGVSVRAVSNEPASEVEKGWVPQSVGVNPARAVLVPPES